jgi:lipoate-protein ligase A
MADYHSTTPWRLVDTGYRSAAENMALDEVILDCRGNDLVPNTIRLLQFDPPAVLVGHHQSIEQEIRVPYCHRHGIDINRRLTGGGAIYFDKTSLGWEIIASKKDLGMDQPSTEVFEWMCQGTITALKMLGIPAVFRPKNDIEVNGRKISGTGGTERNGAFLFQGTLLIDFDVDTMLRALKIPIMKLKDKEITSVKDRVTCVHWELEHAPTLEKIKHTLIKGFEKTLKIPLQPALLSTHECHLLQTRQDTFTSPNWVSFEREHPESPEVSAIEKTPGGLIRVSLALDRIGQVIKSALITGDFFVFPSRAIMDLEAQFKYASYEATEVQHIIHNFFATHSVHIPGVTPQDLVKLFLQALEKMKYESLGIALKDANHLYSINHVVSDVIKDNFEVLLLPYCAKLVTCEFRNAEGCVKCGKCSVGTAYELAEKTSLIPITIKNFEHLMKTLRKLEQQNVKGYLGCCCEGFYCKHHDDLKQVEIPGILVDINDQTCYDLGKEEEALHGTFESQTELKVDLLTKLVERLKLNNL